MKQPEYEPGQVLELQQFSCENDEVTKIWTKVVFVSYIHGNRVVEFADGNKLVLHKDLILRKAKP